MDTKVPPPPDAREEAGHSREKVRLRRPTDGGKQDSGAPEDQADGYADTVKSPPGNRQRH